MGMRVGIFGGGSMGARKNGVWGLRETAQDAEGQSLRIVHGAGRGMWWLIALVAVWRKAIQSFDVAQDSGFAFTTALGRAEGAGAVV